MRDVIRQARAALVAEPAYRGTAQAKEKQRAKADLMLQLVNYYEGLNRPSSMVDAALLRVIDSHGGTVR